MPPIRGSYTAREKQKCSECMRPYTMLDKIPDQVRHVNRLVGVTDIDCMLNLGMDRNTFGRLCQLLRHRGGLKDVKNIGVEDQVAKFIGLLVHHKNNKFVDFNFEKSDQTVPHYVHEVLQAVLQLHDIFLVQPEPVPEDCLDPRWKWFKGCLGALDAAHINVLVDNEDKGRYRNKKREITTNNLVTCDRNLRFGYILVGWEGSASDSRVLRDAVIRDHGLKVPKGNYYLCDYGYTNSEGFLTPYKKVRYHLKDWGPTTDIPQNAQEMFNLRHAKARNIIERAVTVLKMRWGILRSPVFFPIKVQTRLIMASVYLHNFIRAEMDVDPIEQQLGVEPWESDNEEAHGDIPFVEAIDPSLDWNRKRDELAKAMWLHGHVREA